MAYYLGLDLGTTGMKAVVTDEKSNIVSKAEKPSPMDSSGKKREFDADGFVSRVFSLIKEAASAVNGDIAAVAAASASGNTVFLDACMKPLCPVISWTDERAIGLTEEILPGFDLENVHEDVGWPYLESFSLAHIAWVKKYRPDVWKNAAEICMSTEYLNYCLCGRLALDPSTAVPFYMVDQKKGAYNKKYLEYFGLTEQQLPELMKTGDIIGYVTEEAAELCGLSEKTKVVLGSFDHPCAARGSGVRDEKTLLLSCGTSWTCEFLTKDRASAVKQGLLTDAFDPEKGLWLCIYSIAKFGQLIDAAVEKYIGTGSDRFVRLNEMAEAAYKKGEYFFADIADQKVLANEFESASAEVQAASIMAGACAALKKGLESLEKCGLKAENVVMAGGPTKSPVWIKIMADVLGKNITVTDGEYSGAVGAAGIAAKSAGG